MKTYQPTQKEIKRERHTIDASGVVLGRLATRVATLLMGKQKPSYSPHMDSGDFVTVTNADMIVVTGKKESQKVYYSHSGYPGGFKKVSFQKMKDEQPAKVIELAVKRMLPTNRLRDKRMRRLSVKMSEK